MKILVTGATGFIGRHLVKELVRRRHDVTCLIRDINKIKYFKKLDVKTVHGDLFDEDSLKKAVKKKDIVYHLAAEGNLSANSEEDFKKFFRVNAEGTRKILEAVRKYGKKDIKKIVCFSSTAAVGLKSKPVDETTKPKPISPYQRSKFQAEKIAENYFKKYKMPVCIVRPSMVFGPYSIKSEILKMCKFIKKGIFILFNNGYNAIPLAYVEDVVNGTIIVGEKGKPGEIYFLTWDKVYTMNDIVSSISKAMNKKPFILRIPKFFSIPLAYIHQKTAIIFGFIPWITVERIKSMTTNRIFKVDKLKKLGYKPNSNLDKAIEKTVKWYYNNGFI